MGKFAAFLHEPDIHRRASDATRQIKGSCSDFSGSFAGSFQAQMSLTRLIFEPTDDPVFRVFPGKEAGEICGFFAGICGKNESAGFSAMSLLGGK
ncbi:MAG: hypothetical protein AAB215_02840 [Planctomycetota bacterium]